MAAQAAPTLLDGPRPDGSDGSHISPLYRRDSRTYPCGTEGAGKENHMTALQHTFLDEPGYWRAVKDGNAQAFEIYSRHYSYHRYADGRRERYGYRNRHLIVGPGEKIVLLGSDARALCCWRRGNDASSGGEKRVYCTVFRNEGDQKASDILKSAMALAWQRWPGESLWTYVDPNKVRSEIAGYCFRRARWKHIGETAGGLLIFRIADRRC